MYLTGHVGVEVAPYLDSQRIGYLKTPLNYCPLMPGWVWAADNGSFGSGWPGEDRWLEWLAGHTLEERGRCLFAAAPDIVGDSAGTLERSAPLLPLIRNLGYPAALVAQDGLTVETSPWGDFDVLFVGGTTEWKLGPDARFLIREAKSRGMHVHVGRVNSQRRFLSFAAMGCDTVDGTYLKFGPRKNLPNLLAWIRHHETQPHLFAMESG